jgi:hypothetical protein
VDLSVLPEELIASADQIAPAGQQISSAKVRVQPATQEAFMAGPEFITGTVVQWFGEQMDASLYRLSEAFADHAARLRVQANEYVRNDESLARSFG